MQYFLSLRTEIILNIPVEEEMVASLHIHVDSFYYMCCLQHHKSVPETDFFYISFVIFRLKSQRNKFKCHRNRLS